MDKVTIIIIKDILTHNNPPSFHSFDFMVACSRNATHLIGLRLVREIIEQHDGIFNISQNGEWFNVEIMLLKSAV